MSISISQPVNPKKKWNSVADIAGLLLNGKLGSVDVVVRVYDETRSMVADKLLKLSHPNIVTFYGCERRQSLTLLAIEKCLGSLEDGVVNCFYDEMDMMDELAAGLKYLHENGLVYGKITAKNALISADPVVLKWADFDPTIAAGCQNDDVRSLGFLFTWILKKMAHPTIRAIHPVNRLAYKMTTERPDMATVVAELKAIRAARDLAFGTARHLLIKTVT